MKDIDWNFGPFKIDFSTPNYCGKELMRYGHDGSYLAFHCEIIGEHDTHRFTMSHSVGGNIIRVIVEMEEDVEQ